MIARYLTLLGLFLSTSQAQVQSLAGTVKSTIDSAPVARAKVTISGGSVMQAVLTDASGGFTFGGVPTGTYNLHAERAGYLAPQGQPGEPSATAFVTIEDAKNGEEKKPQPVLLQLTRGATLTGTVTDDHGLPLPSSSISLIRRVVSDGRAKLMSENQANANDLGEFRLSGLAAGTYLVCVSATTTSYLLHHGLTRPFACFPDVTDPRSAEWVRLSAGEQRTLAFHVAPVHGIHVSGTVDTGGKPFSMWIKRTDPPGFPQLQTAPLELDEKTGSFEVRALTPGDYLITANSQDGQNLRAFQALHAGTEDIRDLRLMLRDGPYLSGNVRMGDEPAASGTPVGGNSDGDVVSIFAHASGAFRIPIQEPGEYAVTVLPRPGWKLQSVTQAGADIRDSKIVIGADTMPDPVEIVLSQGGGMIEVSFPNENSKTGMFVTLALMRQSSKGQEWVMQGQPMGANTLGASMFVYIPAGDYSLFVWPAGVEIEYGDAGVLRQYESYAQAITVREGETTRVTAKPIPVK